jgi:hypothetical protein
MPEHAPGTTYVERLERAVKDLLEWRVGTLPREGYIRDNDISRAAIDRLVKIVNQETTE